MQAYKNRHVLNIMSFTCHVLLEIRPLFLDFTQHTTLKESRTFRALMCPLPCLIFSCNKSPYWARAFSLSKLQGHTQSVDSVGLFGLVMSSTRRPLPDKTLYPQETDIHAAGGIRTCNPSKWVAADPRLRPSGHWDHLFCILVQQRHVTRITNWLFR